MKEVGDVESGNSAVNVYIHGEGKMDKSLKYWRDLLLYNEWTATNLFYDEKGGDIASREGFNECLYHYIKCADNAELLVQNLKTLSENELEARVIRYMFSQCIDSEIQVMEKEREDERLEAHIAEICSSGEKYRYNIGIFDKKKLNQILMYKAKFEMMLHQQGVKGAE